MSNLKKEKVTKTTIVTFDDWVTDEHGTWTQVCHPCLTTLGFEYHRVESVGSGMCGVEGCDNESLYYVTLNDDN